MKSLGSWLTVFFLAIFWVFRIIVAVKGQFGDDFGGFIVFDTTIEIVLLFVSILCFILILRRMLSGAIIYLVGYGYYFGSYLITNVFGNLISGAEISMTVMQNAFVAILGLLLGLCALLSIAFDRVKSKHFSDNQTDWYFNNKDYDRELDERADKNQYRTL